MQDHPEITAAHRRAAAFGSDRDDSLVHLGAQCDVGFQRTSISDALATIMPFGAPLRFHFPSASALPHRNLEGTASKATQLCSDLQRQAHLRRIKRHQGMLIRRQDLAKASPNPNDPPADPMTLAPKQEPVPPPGASPAPSCSESCRSGKAPMLLLDRLKEGGKAWRSIPVRASAQFPPRKAPRATSPQDADQQAQAISSALAPLSLAS